MTLHTVRVGDVGPEAWRNGGGTTRVLLTWPSAQAWAVRVSVADIERDGPFSAFEGVERWFAVLEGAGVDLTLGDKGETMRVAAGDAPLRFDGARPLHCRLVDGATRDLNVMVVRKRGRVDCDVARANASSPRGDLVALFAQDAARIAQGDSVVGVDAMSLAWSSQVRASWRVVECRRAWWIAFERSAA